MMARQGPSRAVDERFWEGRLVNARAFLDAARRLDALAVDGENANPLVSLVVLAAIAYGDTVTAKARHEVNRHDHQALAAAVRAAVGNRAPAAELRRLSRILAEKDAAEYSARHGNLGPARRLLEELEAFAGWVEQVLPTL
jgi:hypothetical protein